VHRCVRASGFSQHHGMSDVAGYLRDVSDATEPFELYAGRTTIGRAESNVIKLASKSVSSRHAEIEIDLASRPPKLMVTDVGPEGEGSRNATFLNEVRLQNGSQQFEWGDCIRFGYDTVTYRIVKDLEEYAKGAHMASPLSLLL
jgi:pSer/pThr/pTyr-binding forkhead associated (FHA) protein